jgi:phospholipase C
MQPIGLGPRVPMIVVSPWSQGGWVCSQVFDHTSVLRFLETRFGIQEPNISAWRRAVCGDLTAAFDFSNHSSEGAVAHFTVPKPVTTLHRPYHVPGEQQMPRQEAGTRKSRALPYLLMVNGHSNGDKFYIEFTNSGQAGAAFSVHDGTQPESPPRRYAVSAGDQFRDAWQSKGEARHYDITVYGPHGYLRQFRGDLADRVVEAKVSYVPGRETVLLSLTNSGTHPIHITVTERYTGIRQEIVVPSGEVQQHEYHLESSYGWYDLSITSGDERYLRRFAGHVETGRPGTSDPATYLEG